MSVIHKLDKIGITVRSHKLLKELLDENLMLDEIMRNSKNETEALVGVKNWVMSKLKKNPDALKFYKDEKTGHAQFKKLKWFGLKFKSVQYF